VGEMRNFAVNTHKTGTAVWAEPGLIVFRHHKMSKVEILGLLKKAEKKMMNRNPVMPSRAQLTIFYNVNQACLY